MERGSRLEREAREFERRTLREHLREVERERRRASLAAFGEAARDSGKSARDMSPRDYARFKAGFRRALIGGEPR